MKKHGPIQETECMEFLGGEKRITFFLGHEQMQGGRSKGKLKGISLSGSGKTNSHPSTVFNAQMGYLGFNGESSLKNIKGNVTVM